MKKISVIGAGTWGTALAVLLGEKGFDVKLCPKRKQLSDEIESKRENTQYLPGIKIPQNVIAEHSLKRALKASETIIVTVPSEFFRNTIRKIKPYFDAQIIISAAKGLEYNTCKTMSQAIEEELGKKTKIAVLSGPNHAKEVSRKLITASIIASKDGKVGKIAADSLGTDYFRIYQLNDIIGVEICGALKNTSAIAVGICDGIGLGDNANASILTLGLMEMNNFGRHFGAKRGTVYGLAGVGDLIATCTSKHSRNRFVGEQLSKGKTMEEIKKEMHGMVAEGIPTAKAVYEYSRRHGIEMPLTHQVYEVLFEGKNINTAIRDLLNLV